MPRKIFLATNYYENASEGYLLYLLVENHGHNTPAEYYRIYHNRLEAFNCMNKTRSQTDLSM